DEVAGGGHHITQYGTGGGHSPGTCAVEHQSARRGRFHEDGVVRPAHTGQGEVHGHQCGVYSYGHPGGAHVGADLGDGEQFDHVPGLGCGVDVPGGDLADALHRDVGDRGAGVEGQGGDDGGLGGGIEAFDIGRGVRLG